MWSCRALLCLGLPCLEVANFPLLRDLNENDAIRCCFVELLGVTLYWDKFLDSIGTLGDLNVWDPGVCQARPQPWERGEVMQRVHAVALERSSRILQRV